MRSRLREERIAEHATVRDLLAAMAESRPREDLDVRAPLRNPVSVFGGEVLDVGT